jgi:mortality factor 4-like protein 1
LFAKSQFFDNVKKSLTLVSLLYNDSWDEWIRLDCLLKHSDENIEKQKEQGLKQQGIKSAMAWKVSKMKPRSPNVARGRKRKQDSVDTVIAPLVDVFA